MHQYRIRAVFWAGGRLRVYRKTLHAENAVMAMAALVTYVTVMGGDVANIGSVTIRKKAR